MRTQTDIITEVLVRNNRTTTDAFITDTIIKTWYKDAHIWASSLHKWPFTEGKQSTTYTTSVTDDMGNAVIPYFEGWKADSIRIITIGGKRMQKMEFGSFLRFIENNSTRTDRIYSDYGRQLYVNVKADVSGTLTAYGQYTPYIDITDESGVSIFSDFDAEGNEAIVEKMTSYLKNKEHLEDEAEKHDKKASEKLEEVWKRISDEQYAYQTRDQAMFDDFDVLSGRGINNNNFREDQF